MNKRVAPSAALEAAINGLLSDGLGDAERLAEVGRLGARLVLQRALEEEVADYLGRARYERAPAAPECPSAAAPVRRPDCSHPSDAPALPAQGGSRGLCHRSCPALGPGRGPPPAPCRGGRRSRPGFPPRPHRRRRLPFRQDLRQLAAAGLRHPQAGAAGPDDPGVGRPRRELGRLRAQRLGQKPLLRSRSTSSPSPATSTRPASTPPCPSRAPPPPSIASSTTLT